MLAVGVSADALRAGVERLAPIVAAADFTGRPLGAANTVLPLSDEPAAAFWQLTATIREHRGDGHIAALVAHSISGLESHVLQVGVGRLVAEGIRGARGWSEPEWDAGVARLQARGLLDSSAVLTETGRALYDEIERQTDEASWIGALSPLGESGVDDLRSLLADSVAAVRESGIFPADNPVGLPLG
jgi:hypothetical protein